jgi:hypothetical protein
MPYSYIFLYQFSLVYLFFQNKSSIVLLLIILFSFIYFIFQRRMLPCDVWRLIAGKKKFGPERTMRTIGSLSVYALVCHILPMVIVGTTVILAKYYRLIGDSK